MTAVVTPSCLICGHTPSDGHGYYQVCERCRGRMRVRLHAFPRLYEALSDSLEPSGGTGERIGTSRPGSRPAARMDALNLLARSGTVSRAALEAAEANTEHLADQHGSISILGVLCDLDEEVRAYFGYTKRPFAGSPQQAVEIITTFLAAQLDVICDELPSVVDFEAEIRSLHRACEATAGAQEPTLAVPIGRCPAVVGGVRCGRVLRVDQPHPSQVRCTGCRTMYTGPGFMVALSAAMRSVCDTEEPK